MRAETRKKLTRIAEYELEIAKLELDNAKLLCKIANAGSQKMEQETFRHRQNSLAIDVFAQLIEELKHEKP